MTLIRFIFNREKAKRILKTFGYRNSQKIQIGDFQYVQVKSGSKLKELECNVNLSIV